MLLLISLFRLEPQISFEEYEMFERSVIQSLAALLFLCSQSGEIVRRIPSIRGSHPG